MEKVIFRELDQLLLPKSSKSKQELFLPTVMVVILITDTVLKFNKKNCMTKKISKLATYSPKRKMEKRKTNKQTKKKQSANAFNFLLIPIAHHKRLCLNFLIFRSHLNDRVQCASSASPTSDVFIDFTPERLNHPG